MFYIFFLDTSSFFLWCYIMFCKSVVDVRLNQKTSKSTLVCVHWNSITDTYFKCSQKTMKNIKEICSKS